MCVCVCVCVCVCITQWANTEAGFADPSTSTSLFPLLRAATDLLMMPKDLLSEESIRQDVGQALSIR